MKKCRFAMALILTFALVLTNFSVVRVHAVGESALWLNSMSLVQKAIGGYTFSNETTENDIKQLAMSAIPAEYDVTVEVSGLTVIPATEESEGQISFVVNITTPDDDKGMSYNMRIPRVKSQNEEALEEDRLLISNAVKNVEVSNSLTKEKLLSVAKGAVKNGTIVEWKTFTKIDATYEKAGSISGYFSTKSGSIDKELRYHAEIPKLERNMPAKELNNGSAYLTSDEWETLRQTNFERYREGLPLFTMVKVLQGVGCVRAREEKDVNEADHSRPDGSKFSTAVPSSFKNNGLGENIFRCDKGIESDPTWSVVGWMNSTTHRTNILNKKFSYIGITCDGRIAVQVFAAPKYKIKSVKSSTGSMTFATDKDIEGEYLICKDESGQKSYIPLDTSYMKKVKKGYVIKLNSKKKVKIKVKKFVSDNISFTDVEKDVKNAALWVAKNNYIPGINDTEFAPNMTCSNADVMTYLYRANGTPMPASEDLFPDVNSTDTFYKPALWAADKGLVKAGLFNPNDACLRGYALYYVWKSVGAPSAKKKTTFTDVPNGVFYADAVAWAEEKGIIKNSGDNCFHGSDWVCTRADMANFLYGAYHK